MPQNGVTGGRVARDEGSEEPILTNLNFQAKTPKNQVGQPPVAADEGNEDPLFDQPKYSGKSTKNPVRPNSRGRQ